MSILPPLQPLIFDPIFKEKIWGGQTLKTRLNKNIPLDVLIGESWEISSFEDSCSKLQHDAFPGYTIPQLIDTYGDQFLGDNIAGDSFPLLFKFIDANDKLSVQVHPNDAQVQQYGWGRFGKTEAWYIIDAKPGAQVIAGFNKDVATQEVRQAITDGNLERLLNRVDIRSGDVIFIPAGTVHANLEGALLYETQQSSDTTLRLYDWGRVDSEGNSRELHIEDALKVVQTAAHDLHKITPLSCSDIPGVEHEYRIVCRYFALEEFRLIEPARFALPAKSSFKVLAAVDGKAELAYGDSRMEISKGQSVLIPAGLQDAALDGESGMHFLLTSVPDLKSEIIAPLQKLGFSSDQIIRLGGYAATNDIAALLDS